jgi:hypothetical protein
MKLATVNVIEYMDGTVSMITAFSDDEEGNKEAEVLFTRLVEHYHTDHQPMPDELATCLEDGYFFDDKKNLQIFITHSEMYEVAGREPSEPAKNYVICGKEELLGEGEILYWNNEYGWTHKEVATIFTQGERDTFNLPIGGEWELITKSGKYQALARDIMQNYPEYSFCVRCIGWDYQHGKYLFVDDEAGREYPITEEQIAEALPKVRQMIAEKKLFFDGLNSSDESFMDGCHWDSISTDAVVQVVLFGEVIYG